MRVLSLFSGGGLGDYGLTLAGMEIVGQVEIDDYCQKILSLRWPDVPKWRDIKNVTGKEIIERCGDIDLVAGGFPCQPFSVAGSRIGKEDRRHLWPEMSRIICEIRPRWVLAENVTGLLSISDGRVFGDVVRDLAASGYSIKWDCIPASACGAPHRRDRVWIIANTDSDTWRPRRAKRSGQQRAPVTSHGGKNLGNASSLRCGRPKIKKVNVKASAGTKTRAITTGKFEGTGHSRTRGSLPSIEIFNPSSQRLSNRVSKKIYRPFAFIKPERSNWWITEPAVGRVANGVASRVDRLKLLGNGQVVQVVEWIGKQIMESHKAKEEGE